MEGLKDGTHLYEVERRARHVERPGFRISELQISPKQKVPWHYHSNIQDTFYVLEGEIRIFLREPNQEVPLKPGETYTRPDAAPAPRCERRQDIGDILSSARHRALRLRPARVATGIVRSSRRKPAEVLEGLQRGPAALANADSNCFASFAW